MNPYRLILAVLAAPLATAGLPAATLVVDLGGSGDYTEIQPAIDAAGDGDEVLVRPGEYVITEPIDFNRLHDPADSASPPVKNIALRSEAGAEETVIRMAEEPADLGRASVLVFESGETGESLVEGFTVKGGTGSGTGWGRDGGGVYCSDSSPTLADCTITGNSVTGRSRWGGYGGGVYFRWRSSPTLRRCTIAGNSAGSGGGVYCGGGTPTLRRCTIAGNTATRTGGGVSCGGDSFPTLTDTIVWGNAGGSLSVEEDAEVSFCCIEGEEAWPGDGNIRSDPLFCGYSGPGEVFVDAASAEGGDGTAERPLRDLATALEYRLSLRGDSPCIGAGRDGEHMGADLGTCAPGEPSGWLTLHVAPGRYRVEGVTLAHGASVVGEGPEGTVLEGTLWGLRTGATLTGVTVTGGISSGIVVGGGERPDIDHCTITGNSATAIRGGQGGGVHCGEGSSPTLRDCTITGNSVTVIAVSPESWVWAEGGGVYCGESSSPTLSDCTIKGNSVTVIPWPWGGVVYLWGGGVYCAGDSLPTLLDCTIEENTARRGGGVYCAGDSLPTLMDCTIEENTARRGGGVYTSGKTSPVLTRCTITRNSAERDGGGVSCEYDSSPTLADCEITGNSAGEDGGGVSCGNDEEDDEDDVSAPTLTGCTITGNSAESDGGGVYSSAGSSPTLTNCTLAGNSAGGGGGVYCGDASSPALTNCTLAGNSAGFGGGAFCSDTSSPTLTNCIVWRNFPNSACGADALPSCLTDEDPMFTAPGRWHDNETPDDPGDDFWIDGDYRLRPGSPAIDAGTADGAPSFDMDGNVRPCGAGVDIGAFELQIAGCGVSVRFRRGDSNADHRHNVSDAIFTLRHVFQGAEAPPCPKAADADDSGELDLTDAVFLLEFLFLGGDALPAPFPGCGWDPTIDALECEGIPACE